MIAGRGEAKHDFAKGDYFFHYDLRYLKSKIFVCIVVTDIFHNTTEKVKIVWQLTIFNIGSDQIAKYPPEVFVAGIGEETSGIG